jgi:hydrogenase-4 component B
MLLFIVGCLIQVLGGWIALLAGNNNRASLSAIISTWIGCVLVAIPVVNTFTGNIVPPLDLVWGMPGGMLSFGMDTLSAFFCLPFLIVSPLAALYGKAYLKKSNKTLGAHWFFFNLLVASMLLLLVARNGLLFLVVWEIMAVSSFFLVMHDHEQEKVSQAGWTYLVATHIGTAALLAFFAILGSDTGTLQFDGIMAKSNTVLPIGLLFILSIFGFGVKAGFFPLHVWLPEAHPAAPSHVSALMSGVMIKTGIYGILRTMVLLGYNDAYLGWALVIIGVISGITGVVFALAQHDLKRLLAYHSVENIGIITIGIGAGVLGMAWKIPALVFLGFGGGLLHVMNHALFKSLLFLGAGSVGNSTGTLDMELLGGLIKKMRWTAATFLIGAAAISGLPPFNGFISEFYIYFAGITGTHAATPGPIILAACIFVSLALIGGLAVACFSKAFGIVFLGEPRSTHTEQAHETGLEMRIPMIILAVLCIGIGMAAPLTVELVKSPLYILAGNYNLDFDSVISATKLVFSKIVMLFSLLMAVAGIMYLLKYLMTRGRREKITGTWDCGYARPTGRMQYTASSFAQPLTELFRSILGMKKSGKAVTGYFPGEAQFHTDTPDVAREKIFAPVFRIIYRWVTPIRQLQHGNLSGYLLYIAITLIILLIWKAGF